MNSERLQQLLRQADAHPAPVPSPTALASNIRRLARRRRQRTLLVGTGLVACVVASALWQVRRTGEIARRDVPAPPAGSDRARLPAVAPQDALPPAVETPAAQTAQSVLARIDEEQRLVERLLNAERLQRALAQTDSLQAPLGLPAAEVEQLDRAASAIVLAAERKQQRPELLAAARDDYNLLVQLFPGTRWANLAQDRLMHIAPQLTP